MRNVVLALAAVGVLATAVPATAQYYQEGPSIRFGFGGGPGYGDYDRPRYRGYYDGPRYGYGSDYGSGYRGYGRYGSGCIVTVRRERWDGSVIIRRINRC